MDINNLIREYICLADELDNLKKEYHSSEAKIEALTIKVEYYEKLISILKEEFDITKDYKDNLNTTLKELGILFGIDTVAILTGILNSNPDLLGGLIAFTGVAPIASANILKAKTDKKERSQAHLDKLEYLNELEDTYKKDKWELEQLEVEKENLFDCYLKQLELVASKRREIANNNFETRINQIKRIRKIEK